MLAVISTSTMNSRCKSESTYTAFLVSAYDSVLITVCDHTYSHSVLGYYVTVFKTIVHACYSKCDLLIPTIYLHWQNRYNSLLYISL